MKYIHINTATNTRGPIRVKWHHCCHEQFVLPDTDGLAVSVWRSEVTCSSCRRVNWSVEAWCQNVTTL